MSHSFSRLALGSSELFLLTHHPPLQLLRCPTPEFSRSGHVARGLRGKYEKESIEEARPRGGSYPRVVSVWVASHLRSLRI